MRSRALTIVLLLAAATTRASEIRAFDLKKVESLGRQLYENRNQSQKSLDEVEVKALRAARGAIETQSHNSYEYVVLRDPTRDGYLVYAIVTSKDPDDVAFGGHFRVTVSADGEKVQNLDALSRGPNVVKKTDQNHPGQITAALWTICLVSKRPLEMHVYLSLLHHLPIYVGTSDRAIWKVENGKITMQRGPK